MKAIFISVRTGSVRLPKKALKKIVGKSTIEHLIGRVRKSKLADMVYYALLNYQKMMNCAI